MPRKASQPNYSKNSTKGREYAYCYLFGRRISLGRYGSTESFAKFKRCLETFKNEEVEASYEGHGNGPRTTVGELAFQYAEHMKKRHQEGSLSKDRSEKSLLAMRKLTENEFGFAGLEAEHFGPKALKIIQTTLRETTNPRTGLTFARTYVNQIIDEIRRAFRWGVSEELISGNALLRLKSVSGLRAGQGRELTPREPVCPRLAEVTAQNLEGEGHVGIACAIRFMRWTGCRPDEACRLTIQSIEGLNTPTPIARLEKHKTRHHSGNDRVIQLATTAIDVVIQSIRGRELNLTAPLFQSQRGNPLTRNGIYQAIARICEKHGLERWTAYQLRHLSATEMLEATGSEVIAAAALGHSPNSTIIRRYSRDRNKLARAGAEAIGFRENLSA